MAENEPSLEIDQPEPAEEIESNSSHATTKVGDEIITVVDDREFEAARASAERAEREPESVEADEPQREQQPSMDAQRAAMEQWYQNQLNQHYAHANAQIYRAELEKNESIHKALEFQEAVHREALKKARGDGDADSIVEIETSLRNLENNRRQVGDFVGRLKANPNQQFLKPPAPAQQQQQQLPVGAPRNSQAETWARNNAWMNDPARAGERGYLLAIDKELGTRMNAADPKYFAELTTQMAKAFPNLDVRGLDNRRVQIVQRQRGAQSRTPVASTTTAPAPRANANGKINNPVARQLLRRMGHDPDDPRTQKIWKEHNVKNTVL